MKAPLPTPDVLQEQVLRRIAAQGNIARYPANAVLITEGDSANSLFIILTGRVKVYSASDDGREIVLALYGPGEYIGELALDGGPRSASAMTIEPTACAVVTGASLREFIVAHPDFALHLIQNLIHRQRSLTRKVTGLALDGVYPRVVSLLLMLARDVGGVRVVPERLTQQAIADRVGSSRTMVSLVLKELAVGQYISNDGGHFTIHKTPPGRW